MALPWLKVAVPMDAYEVDELETRLDRRVPTRDGKVLIGIVLATLVIAQIPWWTSAPARSLLISLAVPAVLWAWVEDVNRTQATHLLYMKLRDQLGVTTDVQTFMFRLGSGMANEELPFILLTVAVGSLLAVPWFGRDALMISGLMAALAILALATGLPSPWYRIRLQLHFAAWAGRQSRDRILQEALRSDPQVVDRG